MGSCRTFLSLALASFLFVSFVAPVKAANYTVDTAEYTKTTILSNATLWDTYELTASSGQHVKYTVTVLTSGGCAQLFFVKGHNANAQSDYYVVYSEDSCVGSYSNDFPVGSNDGTRFTVLIMTEQTQDIEYKVDISIYSPAIPDWLLGLIILIIIIVVVSLIGMLIRRRKRKAMQPPQPPSSPPPQPPSSP